MSRVIIEVHSSKVDTRSGVSRASGKPWEISTQSAWVRLLGQPFPSEIKITLENKDEPIQPGIYSLDPLGVLKIGDFKQLEIDDRQIQGFIKFEKELPKAS